MDTIKRIFYWLMSFSVLVNLFPYLTVRNDVRRYFDSMEKISYSTTYQTHYKDWNSTDTWRHGMISGNGEQGVVVAGNPYDDVQIYQNMHFILPNDNIRYCPDTSAELETVRQNIVNGVDITDNQSYDDVYMFHPGAELRIEQKNRTERDFFRYTNYETAEIGVVYTDIKGTWERKTFTSQTDDVTITKISESNLGSKLNLTLTFDEICAFAQYGNGDEVNLRYKIIPSAGGDALAFVAHYPSYEESELKNGGYATVAYVVCDGGEKTLEYTTDRAECEQNTESKNAFISIKDAENVYIIVASDRDTQMGEYDSFDIQTDFALVDELSNKVKSVADKYICDEGFDYAQALKNHTDIFTPMFNEIEFELDGKESDLSNEMLIALQSKSDELNPSLMEKVYYSGRYAQLCSSGVSTQRLYGMWVGEWNAGWGSKYTMDANVNLQTSSMNTGNIAIAPIGYVNFILRQVAGWEENALATHGFTDAIQAPVNSDGEGSAISESCYPYPFRYWNAGASWMLQPIYETLLCYGDMQIPLSDEFDLYELRSVLSLTAEDLTDEQIAAIERRGYLDLKTEILLPLLIKSVNYWDQLLTPEYYTDADGGIHYENGKTELLEGESYCIVPSYSPENNPSNYRSPSTANTAIDISACRDNINMLISVLRQTDSEADVSYYEQLIADLPEYMYDTNGAIKEWATSEFDENNEHRHLSHLYLAWPLFETQYDSELKQAAIKAVEVRASENEASHALVHRALIAARLNDSQSVNDALIGLVDDGIYYNSLMTNHHTNRSSAYCTDFAIGYLGIIHESLVFSAQGKINILPAVPTTGFESGSISGIITRTRAEITELSWNLDEGTATVTVCSDVAQNIEISCENTEKSFKVSFEEGEEKTFTFKF